MECIAYWSWGRLNGKLAGLSRVRVYETPNNYVTYSGAE